MRAATQPHGSVREEVGRADARGVRSVGTGPDVLDTWVVGPVDAGEACLCVVDTGSGSVGVRLVVRGDAGTREARVGDGALQRLVASWSACRSIGAFDSVWWGDAVHEPGPEVAVSTDQANRSLATGGVHVKLLARSVPGDRVGTDLAEHLRAVGFDRIPKHLGTVRWSGPNGEVVVAVASRYLDAAEEGWERFRDQVAAVTGGTGSLEGALAGVRELGVLVGRFHVALATASGILPDPVGRAGTDQLERWHVRAQETIDAAVADGRGPYADLRRRHEPTLRGVVARIDDAVGTPVIRIHGDLHVGQVLRWRGVDHLTDLDGDPLASPEERREPRPAAVDVAAMLRSLDHVGRLADRRTGWTSTAAVERWIGAARARFLAAYRTQLDGQGYGHLLDPRLISPFEAVQAAHELVYAATHLPDWEEIAVAALRGLAPREGMPGGS